MNPIDILLNEDDLNALQLRSKVYLVRPVLGSLATAMIVQARRIADERRVETGGIDDPVVARLLAATQTLDGIWGYTPPMQPLELIGRLKGIREQIAEAIDPTDESSDVLQQALLSLTPTLDYLGQQREFTLTDRVVQYARSVDIDPATLVQFQATRETKRVETFRSMRADIIDVIDDTLPIRGEFEELPIQNQIRLFESIEKAISTAKINAAKSMFYGDQNDRSAEAVIFNAQLKQLNAWAARLMSVDPDFALRRAGL